MNASSTEIVYYLRPDKIAADRCLESMLIGLQALCFQQVFRFTGETHEDPNCPIVIEGKSSGYELHFMSAKALDLLDAGSTISVIPLHLKARDAKQAVSEQPARHSIRRFVDDFFATYAMVFFEQHKEVFRDTFGKGKPSSWPPCSRLLWLARNSHAHNGEIGAYASSLPLRWRELYLADAGNNRLAENISGPDYLLLCWDALEEVTTNRL